MTGHVVVCGGGVAGTVAALALRRAGIDVTVVETRPADDPGGAGIRLNPNALDALRAIDAHRPVIAVSSTLVRTDVCAPDGRRLAYRLAADPASPRGLPRSVLRSRLAQVLHDEAERAGAAFRHGVRVTDVRTVDGRVRAVLDDGTELAGDVLVGADGVGSAVRTRIDPGAPAPARGGTRTIYGWTPDPPVEPPPPEVLRIHTGPSGFFGIRPDPVSGGCSWFTNVPAPGDDPVPAPELLRAALVDRFAGSPAAAVVGAAERVLGFDDVALEHLPRWHRDRMIVIGDALHVAPPASEQGAAMAIEDGVVLAQCLRDHPDPSAAFAAFEGRRRERVEAVVALGLRGTREVHRRGPVRLLRTVAEQAVAWQRRPPTGGPAWAYDHHIDWEQRTRP